MDIGRVIERSGIGLTVAAVVWMFTNFASAADIQRIEARQIRSEIRTLCVKYVDADDSVKSMIAGFIRKSRDELCDINKDDVRCDKHTVEEICSE